MNIKSILDQFASCNISMKLEVPNIKKKGNQKLDVKLRTMTKSFARHDEAASDKRYAK